VAAPASTEFSAIDPARAGWASAALDELAAYVQSQKTTGFLIIQDRKVIYEHNWLLPPDAATFAANFTHGTNARGALQEDVASAQKSFIAILAGVAIDKGLLDISKPVSAYIGPGWSKVAPEQEKFITVRNLMEMNSGLTEPLTYEAPAGRKFFYNTPAYAIMKPVLEKASGQKLDDLTRIWLTEPTGMTDTLWRQRPAGRTETALIPSAPVELVAALGALDRKIYIVRSRKLIVVRTGQAAPDRGFDQQLWLRLMKAAPKD
jgi:CubicO group peptidase (beta-lactamase class C family)